MYGWKLMVVSGLLGAVGLSGGCEGPLTPQATELLKNCYALYEARDDAAARLSLDLFLRDNAKTSRADEAYYLRGLVRGHGGDREGARTDLKAALRRTSNTELRAKTLVALGELGWGQGDMALAENTLRQALEYCRQGKEPSDQARFRLGCVLQRQGRWKDADVQFDRVVYSFGETKLGKLAARRTHCTAWTIQTGAFEKQHHADQSVERLRAKNLPAVRQASLYGSRPLFLVQVGRFPTYEHALTALPDTHRYVPEAFVTTTR